MLFHELYRHAEPRPWVVFIHGAGGSTRMWLPQLEAFRAEFNVLVLDLRGHGRSAGAADPDGERYRFETIAADVLDVMDHAGVASAHFVGVSMGCLVIRAFASLAPGRIESAVIGGAVAPMGWLARLGARAGRVLRHVLPFIWLYRLFAFAIVPRPAHRLSRRMAVKEASRMHPAEARRWLRLADDLEEHARRFAAHGLPVPALFLVGEHDYLFGPAVRRHAARQPHATAVVLDDSGHICNVDRPDAFNRHAIRAIKRAERFRQESR